MMKTTTRSFTTVVTVISVLMVAEAVTFLLAALWGFRHPLHEQHWVTAPGLDD